MEFGTEDTLDEKKLSFLQVQYNCYYSHSLVATKDKGDWSTMENITSIDYVQKFYSTHFKERQSTVLCGLQSIQERLREYEKNCFNKELLPPTESIESNTVGRTWFDDQMNSRHPEFYGLEDKDRIMSIIHEHISTHFPTGKLLFLFIWGSR
jgi:hypothetical protein